MLASNGPTAGEISTSQGDPPSSVAFIHCVGSLDAERREYCSGICCQEALKLNHMLRKRMPDVRLTHFYKEMVAPGKEEFALCSEAHSDPNTRFVRYEEIEKIQVSDGSNGRTITVSGNGAETMQVAADMVVLCPAVVPGESARNLSELLGVKQDRWGFFDSLHSRISSSSSSIRGVYLAGSCQAPMNITQAINQGMAATAQFLSGLAPGKQLEVSPVVASVHEEFCSGCRICVSVCPYRAIRLAEDSGKARVNKVLCMGCGTCVASCPSGAMQGNHFTGDQILAEIQGVLG